MTSRGVGSKKDARNEQKTRSIKMKKKLVKIFFFSISNNSFSFSSFCHFVFYSSYATTQSPRKYKNERKVKRITRPYNEDESYKQNIKFREYTEKMFFQVEKNNHFIIRD